MSVAASSSMTSPHPPSPSGRHRSRPSFAIGYSQPSPLRMSTSSASNQVLPTFPDSRASIPPSPSFPWAFLSPPQNPSNSPSAPSTQNPNPNPSTTNVNPSTPNNPPSSNAPSSSKHFVAPAHPQSHHLHSLPPREKSTRTLILDHTAWRQGRTRFAQGRCELGMTVRFKNEERLWQLRQRGNSGSRAGPSDTNLGSTSTPGQRPGFYIGTTGLGSGPGSVAGAGFSSGGGIGGRMSDFGDPAEVELASSDDEGDNDNDDEDGNGGGGDAKESDGESVRALMYGKHYKQMRRKRKQDTRTHDNSGNNAGNSNSNRMDVDFENEPNSGSDSDDGNDDRYNDNYNNTYAANDSTSRDPCLALLLAARATGIEKVLHAMLAQPPSSPPRSTSPPPYALHSSHADSQHYRAPPPPPSALPSSSSPTQPSPQPTLSAAGSSAIADQSQALPNGLRLRLALMALVNDLFERQPPPGERQSAPTSAGTGVSEDGSSSKPVSSGSASSSDASKQTARAVASLPPLPPPSLPPPAGTLLPPELAVLAQISSQPFYATPSLPSFHTLTLPSSGSSHSMQTANNRAAALGALGKASSVESSQSSSAQQMQRPPPPLFSWTRLTAPTSPLVALSSSPSSSLSTHDKLDPSAATTERVGGVHTKSPTSQPLSTPYPSSWNHSRNQPDKYTPILVPNPSLAKRARGRAKDLFLTGCYAKPSAASTSASSFRSNAPMYNYSSSARPPNLPPGYPLKKLRLLCPRHLREQCKICMCSARGGVSTRIGAGLLKKKRVPCASRQSSGVLAELIPRFLRLSALVAMELGREARGEEPETNDGGQEGDGGVVDKPDASDATHQHAPPESPLLSPATRGPSHAQPTRAWFALLCGLLTRAVLEGYVARDWRGSEYAEVILGVGLGIKGIGTRRTTIATTPFGATNAAAPEFPAVEEEPVDELEPDEMPCLVDAGRVLFIGLLQDVLAPGSKDKAAWSAEDEYAVEMEERLSEFLTVSHTTPDLATHFSQLSEKYPAEPVERAALRFCEAVAKWRGKPELEMYKKHASRSDAKSKSSTPLPLSIEALLASTPTPVPHRPPIDRYFRVPPRSSSTNVTTKLFLQHQQHPPPPPIRVLKRQRSVDVLERESKKEKVEMAEEEDDFGKGLDEEEVQEEVQEVKDEAMQDETGEWVGPYGV